MLSETLEQERKYQEDIRDTYNAGYNKGKREARPIKNCTHCIRRSG